MHSISRHVHSAQGIISPVSELKGSARYRFCCGKCQDSRPPEGGVEMSPGKWRCAACWIEISRKRQ